MTRRHPVFIGRLNGIETSVTVCINRTPITGEIEAARDKRDIDAYGCGLAQTIAKAPKDPEFDIKLNITTPYMPITSDGKAPDLGPFLDQICIAVGRVVKKAHRPNAKHTAAELAVRERLILFCAASGTDWIHAGIPAEAVTHMVVKGLIEHRTRRRRHALAHGSRPRRVASDAARPVKLEAAAKISFGYCCTDQGGTASS